MNIPSGIYEGYLMKKKSNKLLEFMSDYNKRYFYLQLSKYQLIYYKNRKCSGNKN